MRYRVIITPVDGPPGRPPVRALDREVSALQALQTCEILMDLEAYVAIAQQEGVAATRSAVDTKTITDGAAEVEPVAKTIADATGITDAIRRGR